MKTLLAILALAGIATAQRHSRTADKFELDSHTRMHTAALMIQMGLASPELKAEYLNNAEPIYQSFRSHWEQGTVTPAEEEIVENELDRLSALEGKQTPTTKTARGVSKHAQTFEDESTIRLNALKAQVASLQADIATLPPYASTEAKTRLNGLLSAMNTVQIAYDKHHAALQSKSVRMDHQADLEDALDAAEGHARGVALARDRAK